MNNVINLPNNTKTNGEFAIQYQQNGYGGCIPIVNGKEEPSLMFGYASETDKEACMRLLEEALIATDGDIYATRNYIMNAVTIAANDVHPDEAVTVDETEILINYENRRAYEGKTEIANLDDMAGVELPNEAIKALLINRAQLAFAEREVQYYDEDEEDDYEDEDDYWDDDDEDLDFIA
jgi:hypothetical protein